MKVEAVNRLNHAARILDEHLRNIVVGLVDGKNAKCKVFNVRGRGKKKSLIDDDPTICNPIQRAAVCLSQYMYNPYILHI